MFFTYDVVDLTAQVGVGLMNQTILAGTPRPGHH
jgi:hypothetical protein